MPELVPSLTLSISLSIPLAISVAGATGCTAAIPHFDEEPKAEVCGGAVCFSPEHVAVRRWGDGAVALAAWSGTGETCALPRSRSDRTPIAGYAIVVDLVHARAGARLSVVPHDRPMGARDSFVRVRSLRVDAATGRALADEEAVAGEASVIDLDENTGAVHVKVHARWSSGVTSETVLDVAGWPRCLPPADSEGATQ